ncbi:MAG: serine hydrolase domain-containing protein, partial [Sneathiella sp.]
MDITCKPEAMGFSAERLENITAWMQRYIDAGQLAGAQTLVARGGEVIYSNWAGLADVETKQAWQGDTIARFYSMSKPIVSFALMTLYEKGLFHLDDPIEKFLPAFKNMRVLRENAASIEDSNPCQTKPTIHHLLTHCSGLTYDFNVGVLEDLYTKEKMHFGPRLTSLEEEVNRLGDMPLKFEPGTRWNYGVSSDVVGRLIEVISGKALDVFLQEVVFAPLGMIETTFAIAPENTDRFASSYTPGKNGHLKRVDNANESIYREGAVSCLSGGGGLLSSVGDYLKFANMIRLRG